jgi:hypothetical protein
MKTYGMEGSGEGGLKGPSFAGAGEGGLNGPSFAGAGEGGLKGPSFATAAGEGGLKGPSFESETSLTDATSTGFGGLKGPSLDATAEAATLTVRAATTNRAFIVFSRGRAAFQECSIHIMVLMYT